MVRVILVLVVVLWVGVGRTDNLVGTGGGSLRVLSSKQRSGERVDKKV